MKKYKTILIYAYYSYKDPIFQSAVLPYFLNLNKGNNLRFILLTFEKQEYSIETKEFNTIKSKLKKEHNIIWYRFKWRSGRFKILKKLYDFSSSLLKAYRLAKKYNVSSVYSEGFPGAIMGYHIAKLTNCNHIVHTFEPHTDYMIEAGVWNSNSWEAKLLHKYEKKIAFHCSDIMTATNEMAKKLKTLGTKAKIHRVPSCVDTELFKFSSSDRTQIRTDLNVKDNECLLIYLGKFGGMYMDDEAFKFFKACIEYKPIDFKILILSHDNHSEIKQNFKKNNILEDYYSLKNASKDEVTKYLSASDFGFVAVKQNPSKRYCSPIKDGEYWSNGLPIIIPEGISDDYILTEKHNIGIVLKDSTEESFNQVLNSINEWLKNKDVDETRDKCREFALKDRSVKNYQELYKNIFLRN